MSVRKNSLLYGWLTSNYITFLRSFPLTLLPSYSLTILPSHCLTSLHDRSKLLQKSYIIFKQKPDIIDPVLDHRLALNAHATSES